MACKYCFVAPAGRGRPLSLGQVTSAVEYFLKSGNGVNGVQKITFMGGEPFLHFKLLCQSIDYIRSRVGPDSLAVEVFTNGTLLDPDKLKFLESRNVSLTLSIDGPRLTNDLHRVFNRQNSSASANSSGTGSPSAASLLPSVAALPRDNAGGEALSSFRARSPEAEDISAFEKAILALKYYSVKRGSFMMRGGPGVHMIVTPETAGKLVRNVDFFFRRGASRISFTPVFGVFWPQDKIAALKKSLDGFSKYYAFLTAQAGQLAIPGIIGKPQSFAESGGQLAIRSSIQEAAVRHQEISGSGSQSRIRRFIRNGQSRAVTGPCRMARAVPAKQGQKLPFEIGNIYEFIRPAERSGSCSFRRRSCQTLTLGWDGYFYACDKSFSKHGAALKKDRVGSIDSGVDWKRRELQYARAFKWAIGHGWKAAKCFSCPMGVYFSSRGASMLDNFQDVSGVYDSAMKRLADGLKDDPFFRRVHHFHGLERNT